MYVSFKFADNGIFTTVRRNHASSSYRSRGVLKITLTESSVGIPVVTGTVQSLDIPRVPDPPPLSEKLLFQYPDMTLIHPLYNPYKPYIPPYITPINPI